MSHVRFTYSTLNDDIIQIIQEDEVLFSFIKALLLSKFKKRPDRKTNINKKKYLSPIMRIRKKNKDYLIEIHFLHLFDNIIHKFFSYSSLQTRRLFSQTANNYHKVFNIPIIFKHNKISLHIFTCI